jgi:diguanylate cyclase (GGDEF)-like protein
VLDTGESESFDRITRLAANLLDVPIALVVLVDSDRQWFKSRVGLATHETPREHAFCGYTILGNDLFEVPDASIDERFANNPLVTGDPYIRFYAGLPLASANGENLGSLCVIDRKPRSLDARQLEILKDLAGVARHELEVHRALAADPLTGVYNRAGFLALGRRVIKAAQPPDQPVTLVSVDLDDFKLLNDSLGRASGDRVLRTLARTLRENARRDAVCGRVGGDEFALLLPGASEREARKMLERFGAAFTIDVKEAIIWGSRLTFSVGVASRKDSQESIEQLLSRAEAGMREAKTRGGDAVVVG